MRRGAILRAVQALEQILILFVAAVVLAAAARRVGAPYPVFLAIGGALLAFVPGAPSFTLPPELVLALFVAPILVDAGYDASLRDLRDNWAPLVSLVIVAVGLTTAAVAVVAHALVPGLPWAAAIALGAIVAPPDAVAATAVLRPLRPPQRILGILEGESLLNDASALLIYRLAVGAVAAGGFSVQAVAPTFLLAVLGSLIAGPALGWLVQRVLERVQHIPTAIILHVRQHDQRVAGGGTRRPVGRADHRVLRDDAGAHGAGAHAGAHSHPDQRGVGHGGVRAEHLRVHLHRAADPPDHRGAGAAGARAVPAGRGRRAGHGHRWCASSGTCRSTP